MLIVLDTNILISAALNPDGIPAQAYFKAVTSPHSALICEINVIELHRIFSTKLPHRLKA